MGIKTEVPCGRENSASRLTLDSSCNISSFLELASSLLVYLTQFGLAIPSQLHKSIPKNLSSLHSLYLPHFLVFLCRTLTNTGIGHVGSVTSNSVTPWTMACQSPLSMGFSRQEYWSGFPFSTPNTGVTYIKLL